MNRCAICAPRNPDARDCRRTGACPADQGERITFKTDNSPRYGAAPRRNESAARPSSSGGTRGRSMTRRNPSAGRPRRRRTQLWSPPMSRQHRRNWGCARHCAHTVEEDMDSARPLQQATKAEQRCWGDLLASDPVAVMSSSLEKAKNSHSIRHVENTGIARQRNMRINMHHW